MFIISFPDLCRVQLLLALSSTKESLTIQKKRGAVYHVFD